MEICPLTGQPCSHKKIIHVTECGPKYTLESTKDMCIICGSQYLNPQNQFIPFQGIFELFKYLALNQKPSESIKTTQACPNCGITLFDINKTGKLGCSQCYEFFKVILEQLLYKLHGSTRHKGKKVSKKIPSKDVLKDLEEQLAAAIKAEDYEKAAKLRDQINKLKK